MCDLSAASTGEVTVTVTDTGNVTARAACSGLEADGLAPVGLPDRARRQQASALGDLTGDCNQDSQHLLH